MLNKNNLEIVEENMKTFISLKNKKQYFIDIDSLTEDVVDLR